jgi:phosphatidylglycerophosphatase A
MARSELAAASLAGCSLLSRRVRWIILALYIAAALVVYGLYDLTKIHQITWIPFIEYLGVLIVAGIFGAGLWVAGRIKGRRLPDIQAAGE